MKIWDSSRINFKHVILLFVLLLSGYLNFCGIDWGLPAHWYPDEYETIEKTVIPMIRNLDPNPHYFMKPSLYYYLLCIILSPYFLYIKLFHIPIEPYFEFIGKVTFLARLTTASIGVFGVFLIYQIGKILRNEWTGLFSAFCLTISIGYISYSHYAYYDVPMLALMQLSLLCFIRYLKTHNARFLYWGAVIGGLAISTKYNAFIFVGFPLLYCHGVRVCSNRQKLNTRRDFIRAFFSRELVKSFSFLLFAFLCFTPFALLDFKKFLSDVIQQLYTTGGYKVFYESSVWIKNVLLIRDGFQTPLFILVCVTTLYGLFKLIKKYDVMYGMIWLTPLIYFIYVGNWHIAAFRYMSPMMPFLILGSGIMWADMLQTKRIFKIVVGSIIGICLTITTIQTYRGVQGYVQDTREMATEWIRGNLPEGKQIETYAYPPYLPKFSEGMKVQDLRPGFIDVVPKFELFKKSWLGKKLFRESKENILNDLSESNERTNYTKEGLASRNPDYIILSSFYYRRYLQDNKIDIESPLSFLSEYYQALLSHESGYKVIKRFEGSNQIMQRFFVNPTLLILVKEDEVRLYEE